MKTLALLVLAAMCSAYSCYSLECDFAVTIVRNIEQDCFIAPKKEPATVCGVTCTCLAENKVRCCLAGDDQECVEDCRILNVGDGSLSCAPTRKRRDILSRLLRLKRSGETTKAKVVIFDGTTKPPAGK